MRKITREAAQAFMAGVNYSKSNTSVENIKQPHAETTHLYLHGNEIARKEGSKIFVTDAGWQTLTTKERLNGIPGVSVFQKKGVWYLNGKEWDGSIALITDTGFEYSE